MEEPTKPPSVDNTELSMYAMNNLERKEVDMLQQQTFYLLNKSTLLFAIRKGKQAQLVKLANEIMVIHHLEYDSRTGELDRTEASLRLNKARFSPKPGDYRHEVIKWKRTDFVRYRHTITYGNCTKCLRAYPLGMNCQHCPKSCAVKLYFVDDNSPHIQSQQQQIDQNGPPPEFNTRQPAEPIRLGQELIGQPAAFFFDYTSFDYINDDRGYRPNHKHLYSICNLSSLFECMNLRYRHAIEMWGMTIVYRITLATKVRFSEISDAMDRCKFILCRSEQEWDDIHTYRCIFWPRQYHIQDTDDPVLRAHYENAISRFFQTQSKLEKLSVNKILAFYKEDVPVQPEGWHTRWCFEQLSQHN